MNTSEESGDCFTCFNKMEMHFFPPVDSGQHFSTVVNDCWNFLHEDIADNCKWNTVGSNIEKGPPFCKKCFDSVTELTQLNEESSKLKKKISDKKISFSMAVFFRRNQMEHLNKDSDTINNSKKQLIQLDMTGIPPSLFSINPPISAAMENLAHPVENNPFEMDVAVNDPPQSIGIEYCKKDVEDHSSVLLVSVSPEEVLHNRNPDLAEKDIQRGATIRKSSRIEKLNDTEVSSMSERNKFGKKFAATGVTNEFLPCHSSLKESNQSGTSSSISKKSCFPKLSSDYGSLKNRLRANWSNKKAEERNCVNIRRATDRGKLKTTLCSYCTKSFISIATLKVHERRFHTESKDHKSVFCDEVFLESSKLQKGISTHTVKKSYQCSFCEKSFPFSYSLRLHERIHTAERPFKCSYCQKGFTQTGHVRDHERTHTGERPYECYFCEKKFSASNNFQKHIRIHTGEKPYKCTFCEKDFTRCAMLKIHERTHTGEKPYKCTFCQKAFYRADVLKIHERSHSGETPFKCSFCDKAFSMLRNLQNHIRSHTGEKPYKCVGMITQH